MVQQNNISIQVGDVTLSTKDIPKKGIDLKKLDSDTKALLSCFDANNDGKLSRSEIHNAISVFASQDKQYTEKVDDYTLITHKRDHKLDKNELNNVKLRTKQKTISQGDAMAAKLEEAVNTLTGEEVNYKKLANKYLKTQKLNNNGKREAAKRLYFEMVRNKAIQSGKLSATYSKDWLQDANGNHYKFDGADFKKQDGVYMVAKNGSYKAKLKTDNPNKFVYCNYNQDGEAESIQLRSKDGKKAYANKEHVAKKAGLVRDGEYYYTKDGRQYSWQGNKFIRDRIGEIDININIGSGYYEE